jgi:hypothetical protein
MIEKDQLGICPKCKCDGCYITPMNEFGANTYFCWGCGFNTTDFMRQGEFDFEEVELAMPELYKDLAYNDEQGRRWYPSTVNIPDKGTVFLNGTSIADWQWAGILVREATPEEAQKLATKGIKYLSDIKTLKLFGKDFIEACDYVGIFKM